MTAFFNVFSYAHMEDDAFDAGFAYYDVHVLRDITTSSGIIIRKGMKFHQVNFSFATATFSFIDWEPATAHNVIVRPKNEVVIPQADLAPLLRW